MTRRTWIAAAAMAPVVARAGTGTGREVEVIEAPSNLGLRPLGPGEPGTWRAPEVLRRAGLGKRVGAVRQVVLPRPKYSREPIAGTRVRNGKAVREFGLVLGEAVRAALERGAFPVVVGGDCSNLLGCMVGLRRAGGRGLVHVDGHSDFDHPGTYDTTKALGAVAGMDLAVVTGRGEPLVTKWPEIDGALVADADAIQVGERGGPEAYPDLQTTAITRIEVPEVHKRGVAATAEKVIARMRKRKLERAWMHVDLDVLEQAIMPAVDSPGSPGLTFDELAALGRALVRSGRIAGLDVAIYDPELDPREQYAPAIVACVAAMLG